LTKLGAEVGLNEILQSLLWFWFLPFGSKVTGVGHFLDQKS
jgi:hypothetical protein